MRMPVRMTGKASGSSIAEQPLAVGHAHAARRVDGGGAARRRARPRCWRRPAAANRGTARRRPGRRRCRGCRCAAAPGTLAASQPSGAIRMPNSAMRRDRLDDVEHVAGSPARSAGTRWQRMPSGRPTTTAAASEPERQQHVLARLAPEAVGARRHIPCRIDRSFQRRPTSSSADGAPTASASDADARARGRASGASAHRQRAGRRRRRSSQKPAPGETRAKVLPGGVRTPPAPPTARRRAPARPTAAAASRRGGAAISATSATDARPATRHRRQPAAAQRSSRAAPRRARCGWRGP